MKYMLIAIAALSAGLCLAADAGNDAAKVYQMDLFSIISLALAIAALVLSIFMGWLSWEFYKKSTDASEKTQQAVTKIEAAVLGVQSDITEIVRRAVGYWTDGGTSEEVADQNAALTQKVEELSAQIQTISGTTTNKQELEAKLAELVQLQKDQISNLSSSILDAKAKAFFPSIDKGPVVQLTQSSHINTDSEKTGELAIEVLRPSKIATATGKFTPPFTSLPSLSVELVSGPASDLSEITVTSGVGKTFDFNVHLKGRTGLLASGTYVVKYTARAQVTPQNA
ncbi:MAG: hypothetical protein FD157_2079 [Rhodocyclaceae bacterium]|nr:MAG: hypothetical protein FD157_2079 [Rhodocyclaceae bacterium]TND01345.1 MAG: hypothetical protein FD118_2493 [Rhodocyclaceae bacterium]